MSVTQQNHKILETQKACVLAGFVSIGSVRECILYNQITGKSREKQTICITICRSRR